MISKYLKRNFQTNFSSENILIGPGSKELLYQLLLLIKGTVIIPAPSWVSYRPQREVSANSYSIMKTQKVNDYKVTVNDLKNHLNSMNTQEQISIIINNPNNPTGHLYSEDEVKELSLFCKEKNIFIISDEIYSEIQFSEKSYTSFAKYHPEGTVVTGGMSKIYSAGGYRLGFIAIPKSMQQLVEAFSSLISETFSSVSSPIQYASIKAFEENKSIKDYVLKTKEVHRYISHYIYKELRRVGVDSTIPEGAFYLMIDFSSFRKRLNKVGIYSSIELCHKLLNDYHVALLPGCDFYMEKDALNLRLATVDYDGKSLLDEVMQNGRVDEINIEKSTPYIFKGVERIKTFINDLSSMKV